MDVVFKKTYGKLEYSEKKKGWLITEAEPHVRIKLKSVFSKIGKTANPPYFFHDTPENGFDLKWFMERYPLIVSEEDVQKLVGQKQKHIETINALESILIPDYVAERAKLNDGHEGRDYQLRARDVFALKRRLLLADDTGLGKTLSSILCMLEPENRPTLVVVQAHLPTQWKNEIEKYTGLTIHLIKGTRPYTLPPADVYITKYTSIAGWHDFLQTGFFKYVIFDECQELRIQTSQKYAACKAVSSKAEACIGLSATPVYNYGNEIYSILDCINPGCLGNQNDFLREWTGFSKKVKDPIALGTYLRESFLMLRRTRKEVGRELPPVNKIVHNVECDQESINNNNELYKQLAMKVVSGSFVERGQAGRELDMLMRQNTGVGKAVGVANYVRILLEAGEPVLLAGWHRDVYDIWLKELADFKPVMYTGTESPAQKDKAKQDFIDGKTNLFIISLRSGIGLDGLQGRCKIVVIGELDWSPEVHHQLISRVDRDGQQEQVTAIFLVCDEGSDPPIINMLGLKSSQSHGILNPLTGVADQFSDDSRIKALAEEILKK